MGLSVVSAVGSVAASWSSGPIQHQILSRTAVRVSSKQRFGAFGRPESYPAAPTRGILSSFSKVFSSFRKIRSHCILTAQRTHFQPVQLFTQNPHISVTIVLL